MLGEGGSGGGVGEVREGEARSRHRRRRVSSLELRRHILQATPYEVVSLDALTYAGSMDNLAAVTSHERHSFVHGDIRDPDLVRQVVAEVDVIVNAAAESHVEKSIESGASEFVTTNVEGTQILLDAIRETRSSASSSSRRARSTGRRSTRPWTRSIR